MAASGAASHDDQKSNAVQPSERESGRSDADKSSHPVLTWADKTVAGFYQSLAADRTLPAIAREALKDVRSTFHQVAFGQPERGGELGAPLNPLASEIANDNTPQHGVHGPQASPATERGDETQMAGKWVDWVLSRGKDETPYNPDRQHIKPEDEKEQRQEQEKEKNQDRNDDGRGDGGGRGGRC